MLKKFLSNKFCPLYIFGVDYAVNRKTGYLSENYFIVGSDVFLVNQISQDRYELYKIKDYNSYINVIPFILVINCCGKLATIFKMTLPHYRSNDINNMSFLNIPKNLFEVFIFKRDNRLISIVKICKSGCSTLLKHCDNQTWDNGAISCKLPVISASIYEKFFKIDKNILTAVYRDPAERLFSLISNNITLSLSYCNKFILPAYTKLKLDTVDTVVWYLLNIISFNQCNSKIDEHLVPTHMIVNNIGAEKFDYVIKISDLSRFLKTELNLEHHQMNKHRRKCDVTDLKTSTIKLMNHVFEKDFDLFKKFEAQNKVWKAIDKEID